MRIATFNIESLDWSASRPEAFTARVAALSPILATAAADVLCLQEVNAQKPDAHGLRDFHALDKLLEGTPYSAFHRFCSTRPGAREPADVHNLVILSRWPIEASRQVFHDFVPVENWIPPWPPGAAPARLAWDRPMIHAAIASPRGPLHVINLHLRAPRAAFLQGAKSAGHWRSSAEWAEGYYLAARKQHGQALEARLFVETLFDAAPDALIAVCGDLNADAFETPTRLIEALPDDIESADFSARRLEPLERRVAAERRYSVLHDGRSILLDHILASPALAARCTRVTIANEGLVDEARPIEPILGSLHAPIVAEFAP